MAKKMEAIILCKFLGQGGLVTRLMLGTTAVLIWVTVVISRRSKYPDPA